MQLFLNIYILKYINILISNTYTSKTCNFSFFDRNNFPVLSRYNSSFTNSDLLGNKKLTYNYFERFQMNLRNVYTKIRTYIVLSMLIYLVLSFYPFGCSNACIIYQARIGNDKRILFPLHNASFVNYIEFKVCFSQLMKVSRISYSAT